LNPRPERSPGRDYMLSPSLTSRSLFLLGQRLKEPALKKLPFPSQGKERKVSLQTDTLPSPAGKAREDVTAIYAARATASSACIF